MQRNIRLVIAYEGGRFHGWQRQPAVRTVQGTVEDVARRVLREPVSVIGASRTDAGVHARGQAGNIVTSWPGPIAKLIAAVGHRLPEDVALVDAREAPLDFHATRDAVGKRYRYRIFNSLRRPCGAQRLGHVWHIWHPLEIERMSAGAAALVGQHDFAAFASAGSPRENTVRRITRIECRRAYDEITVDVEGTGFLYNQVRNMVGTLVEVGRGHWPVERVVSILASRDRAQAGPTAPAEGLCLEWVRYAPCNCPVA